MAERAGLVGEVLARAAPAYSGWDHRAVITIIQHLLKIIFLQMVMVVVPQVSWQLSSLAKMLGFCDVECFLNISSPLFFPQ